MSEPTSKITPFSDPSNVLFDDDAKSEEYTGPQPEKPKFATGGYTGTGDGKYRPAGILHKGEPVIPKSEIVNSGLPADPYPLTTRVLDALRGRKRND